MSVASKAELIPDDADAASYYRMTDVNDNVCAIIKVAPDNALSNQLVLHTKGGMVPVKSDQQVRNNGEWWFWVSPKVTNVMFTCEGYTPTDWVGLSLQPGKVYRIKLNVDSSVTILTNFQSVGISGIRMTVTPPEATVYYGIGGTYSLGSQRITDGAFDIFLDEGRYSFKVESDFYETWYDEIEIAEGTKDVSVNLKPAFGYISLNSNPQGADVFLDGKPIGTTPIRSSEKVSAGRHALRVQKDNYYAWDGQITVESDGKLQPMAPVTLAKQFGTVTVTCDDAEALLVITDPMNKEVARGKSGMKVDLNSRYTYKLEATKPGHAPQSKGINGKSIEGKEETISIGAPAPMYGSFALTSTPSRADVYIDGKLAGTTAFAQQLLVGKHKVELKKEGYGKLSFEIDIQHNQTLQLSKELKELSKIQLIDVSAEYKGMVNGKQWVDLGLPSGNKWATCNVGASKPEEPGDYYAWGETKTKKGPYTWDEYKWYYKGHVYKWMTKYCPSDKPSYWSGAGTPDGKTILENQDDAASDNWGYKWSTPTDKDWNELMTNCTWTWVELNGAKGYLVTGPNDSNIFIPAAGRMEESSLGFLGIAGCYWTSSVKTDEPIYAWYIYFNMSSVTMGDYGGRNNGLTVRPVLRYVRQLDAVPSPTEKKYANGHEYVDLGLSVKWATQNIGASNPEESGDYFAWAETKSKSCYHWATYSHGWFGYLNKYVTDSYYGKVDRLKKAKPNDDAAIVLWGGKWRMPTVDELEELRTKCQWTWASHKGVNGYLVTGPNGNSIFLPAPGFMVDTKLDRPGIYGGFWSSSLGNTSDAAYILYIKPTEVGVRGVARYAGYPIRPVIK